jgi:hypothetical protein
LFGSHSKCGHACWGPLIVIDGTHIMHGNHDKGSGSLK